jgi:hypothetical protein
MKYLGCPKLSIGSELDLPHHEELNVASRFMATCLAVTEPAVSLSVAAHPIDATANTAAPVNPATRHAFGFCPDCAIGARSTLLTLVLMLSLLDSIECRSKRFQSQMVELPIG